MSLPEDFLKYQIDQILYLQQHFQFAEPFLACVSELFNPTSIHFVIGPLLAAFSGESMVEVMVTMTLADYAALLFKWISHESRPCWWVQETHLYTNIDRPKLRQHHLTCETSAGGPSGHSNMVTIIAYLQGRWIASYLEKNTNWDHDHINCLVFSAVSVVVFLTWVSRTYFAAHFPYQCVAGTTLALSLMGVMEQEDFWKKVRRADKGRALIFAMSMFLTAGSVYIGLVKYGIDPLWSVHMAFKWCENVHYMKPESTPIYNLTRNIGSAFGIALCAPLKKKMAPSPNRWKSVPVAIGFIALDWYLLSKTPKDKGGFVFLLYTFTISLFHSYAMIKLVSKISHWGEDVGHRSSSFDSQRVPHFVQNENELTAKQITFTEQS